MSARPFVFTSLVLLLTSCSIGNEQAVVDAMVTQCDDPRPQFCTADYRPVCAIFDDRRREEFSNGCSACSNALVTGWIDGACL